MKDSVHSRSVSRRRFLAASTLASAAATGSTHLARASKPADSPNGRLRIGFIGTGNRCQAHLRSTLQLQAEGGQVEAAAVCDVFNKNRDDAADQIEKETGSRPQITGDYRELLDDASLDAVVIATPDHWHATQTTDALRAGKHVYCEKPMTHTVEQAIEVMQTWQKSGKVMQVGVQSTALPVWRQANQLVCEGKLGKVLQYQTEFFRNSSMGQWRYYELTPEMTPKNIDWKMFLGTEQGLSPELPFDRAVYRQWRCYWPFGSGMYTDLFVHRTTSMLLATGLRFPGRVVGGGGLYLEYDGRDVPDVATVVADFPAGVQGIVTATMCSQNAPIRQLIRGHHGSFVFGNGEKFSGFDFVAERPQVTGNSRIVDQRFDTEPVEDTSLAHFDNFVRAALAEDPAAVNCPPDLGAAAMVTVKLGAMSYREGKVYHFDPETLKISEGDASWAKKWEAMSEARAKPRHVSGWRAGDVGSLLVPKEHQKLAGPWIDGVDPASS